MGGGRKLEALEEIVALEDPAEGMAGVMYVGDSITDTPPLAAVRAQGGAAVSFNGNGYALAAAEVAVAAAETDAVGHLAAAFAAGGRDALLETVRSWPKPKKGEPPSGKTRSRVGIIADDPEALAEASAAMRLSVRGERIAGLG